MKTLLFLLIFLFPTTALGARPTFLNTENCQTFIYRYGYPLCSEKPTTRTIRDVNEIEPLWKQLGFDNIEQSKRRRGILRATIRVPKRVRATRAVDYRSIRAKAVANRKSARLIKQEARAAYEAYQKVRELLRDHAYPTVQ